MRAVSFSILLLLSTCALATDRPCGSYPAAAECVRSEIVIRSRAQPVYPLSDDVNIITKDDEIEVATPSFPEDSEESDETTDSDNPEDSDESEDANEPEDSDGSDENDNESDSEDADSEDADSEDADSEDADSEDADSEDTDSEDADSEDADSEDADSEDADSGDNDSEDTDSEDTDSEDTDSEDADSEETDSEDQDSENEENTANVVLHLDNIIQVNFPTYYAKSVYRNITVSVGQTEIIDFAVWDEGYTTITVQITEYGVSADYETTFYIQDGLPLTVSSNFISSDINATITTIIPGTTVLDIDNAITRLHLLSEFEYDYGSGMEEAASQNTHIAEVLAELDAEPMIFKSQLAEAFAPVFAKTFFDRNLFIYNGN